MSESFGCRLLLDVNLNDYFLAALTTCFLEINVLVFEISRETDKKIRKKSADLVSNCCHDKTNSPQPSSASQSLAVTKQQ